jgi:hypothetical protein
MATTDFNYKDGAREFVGDIEGHARIALAAKKILTLQNETELLRALDRLRPAFDELAARVDDSDGHRALWHLMAAAYTIGSRSTVTGNTTNAVNAFRRSDDGKASGVKRRDKAWKDWGAHALKFAQDYRARHKRASTERVKKFIMDECEKIKVKCPETRITGAIREWEDNGKIPRKITGA